MAHEEYLHLRALLLDRREEIFGRLRQFESDWQTLGERDIEWEEEAQKADISALFDRLDERGKERVAEIDLALCRMAAGSYGTCESCEELIPLKRLQAIPEARLCLDCTRKYEKKGKKLARAREAIPCSETPDEYRHLTDEELEMLILDHLRHDGRIALDELEIGCRKGVVYLEGIVPSETEHQLLLQILMDTMGFTSLVDLLRISEIVWEREDRTPGKRVPKLTPVERMILRVEEGPAEEPVEEENPTVDLPERR